MTIQSSIKKILKIKFWEILEGSVRIHYFRVEKFRWLMETTEVLEMAGELFSWSKRWAEMGYYDPVHLALLQKLDNNHQRTKVRFSAFLLFFFHHNLSLKSISYWKGLHSLTQQVGAESPLCLRVSSAKEKACDVAPPLTKLTLCVVRETDTQTANYSQHVVKCLWGMYTHS